MYLYHMKPYEIFLNENNIVREILDIYLELRQHFQELKFKESELSSPPVYTTKMMLLHDSFSNKMKSLLRLVNDYGFEMSFIELTNYMKPLLEKINELTPLKDGNN
jgi:hypothetical protein